MSQLCDSRMKELRSGAARVKCSGAQYRECGCRLIGGCKKRRAEYRSIRSDCISAFAQEQAGNTSAS